MEEILSFPDRRAFREWLANHHDQEESIWILLQKNQPDVLKPEEALEEALCYGWIDSLIARVDDKVYRKKFSKRRAGSVWSDKNKKLIAKLTQEGKMTEWGLRAVETAQRNGKWEHISLKAGEEEIARLAAVLHSHPQALQLFEGLNNSTRKQFAAFYKDAKKEETRRRRLEKIVRMLEENKRFI